MARFEKQGPLLVVPLVAVLVMSAAIFMQGCKDQAKQDFVNGILSIIEANQAQPEIAEEGSSAFQAYVMSGFNDLENARKAAESFARSIEKDQSSLERLEALSLPDDQAATIAGMLEEGIVIMDEGNALYVEELAKAPTQSVEERSMIFEKAGAAMGMYLEGLSAIIASLEELLEYSKTNKLEGEQEINTWIDKFKKEKQNLEDAMQYM